jgi:hypothetical protein
MNEAINIRIEASKLHPDGWEWWQFKSQACKLEQNGLLVEATETRFKPDTLTGEYCYAYLHYGDRFFQLNKHDRAWQLCNKTILLAAKEKSNPHTARTSMVRLLENNKNMTRLLRY